jgi:hypothetical protein
MTTHGSTMICCNNEINKVIDNARCFTTAGLVGEWFECRHTQCYIHVLEHSCCIKCGNRRRLNYPNICRECHELLYTQNGTICYSCETDTVERNWALVVGEMLEMFR